MKMVDSVGVCRTFVRRSFRPALSRAIASGQAGQIAIGRAFMRSTYARVQTRHALVAAVVGCVSVAGHALAADRHWSDTAPSGSTFQDATRWVEGQVPGAADRAIFAP